MDPSNPSRAPTPLQATSVPRMVPTLAKMNAMTVSLAVEPSLQNMIIFRHPLVMSFQFGLGLRCMSR